MEFKSNKQEPIAGYPQGSLNSTSISTMTKMLVLVAFVFSISIPMHANAGIFSQIADFFSGDAKADTIDNGQNSQTAPVLEAKLSTNPKDTVTDSPLKMNEDDVLMPEVGALGTALDVEDYPEEDEINVYITKKGDTLSKIAQMYKVSVNTIVWANDGLDPKKALKEGTSLLIMPISGVSHTVAKGDTLNKIAKKYAADADEIARFNGVTDETLAVGDIIVVPNGELAIPKKATSTSIAKKATNVINNLKVYAGNGKGTSRYIAGYDGPSQGGYYRKPVYCVTTQGLHGKNGIDLGCKVGTPVAAAASGTVIAARGGWNGGYGNMIIISHPNGTQTLYGHLSRINVTTGQDVGDGEIIGATGNSGQSTGPHLHFEVRGARNCYVDGSCR
jgi:murein DD-endopeptidase MepM/ murein hydrolase activator NlpD